MAALPLHEHCKTIAKYSKGWQKVQMLLWEYRSNDPLNHHHILVISDTLATLEVKLTEIIVLKTLYTIGNFQRLVFTVGVSLHMHKITNQ